MLASVADINDLVERDFHVQRVVDEYEIDVETYLDKASEYVLRVLKYDWWKKYAGDQGFAITKLDENGNTVSNFDENKLVLDNYDLINIHCFYTLHLIYRGVTTQLASNYETAQRNSDFWKNEFETYFDRLTSVSDFYDYDKDGVIAETELYENPYVTQRFGRRYIR